MQLSPHGFLHRGFYTVCTHRSMCEYIDVAITVVVTCIPLEGERDPMWDSKLASHRREVGHALASRREARLVGSRSLWARFAIRHLERSERHAHRRFLSAALRDQRVLAVVYGEREEEEEPHVWQSSTSNMWWNQIVVDEEEEDYWSFINRPDRFEEVVFEELVD